jgi:poly(A) polymerase
MTRLDPTSHGWMHAPATLKVLTALGGEARFVGGAVRNGLIGRPVEDVDIATPLKPETVIKKLEAAGIKAVPTGLAHGTVTAVADGRPYEITTLRRDLATDGRHAVVAFGTSWRKDAARRDFTMNALYADIEGEIYDYAGGVEDLAAGRVRFVGDPAVRIAEDYLRILRLFRFYAWYGKEPLDAEALAAVEKARAGIDVLSGERIQKEMLKLLAAPAPAPALKAMDGTGVLEALKLDGRRLRALSRLAEIDRRHRFLPDPLLRLAVFRPDAATISDRWRLANVQRKRLEKIAGATAKITIKLKKRETRRILYRVGVPLFIDLLYLAWAEDTDPTHEDAWVRLLERGDFYLPPRFPFTGRDVLAAGVPEGPKVAGVLALVEDWWVENDFPADKALLAEKLEAAAKTLA